MQETPILDTFLDDLRESIKKDEIEGRLTKTLVSWVNDTLVDSTAFLDFNDGKLSLFISTQDDVVVKKDFEAVVGVGSYTHADEHLMAKKLASALRAVANKLDQR